MARRDVDYETVASERGPHPLFDVTVRTVIGTVTSDFDVAPVFLTPQQVAFKMINDYDSEGTFEFPTQDGRIMRVTVEYGDA